MKTWILAILALLLGVGCGAASVMINIRRTAVPIPVGGSDSQSASSGAVSAARVELLNGADFDFGVMEMGESSTHVFTIQNSGGTPLNLELSSKTCKCTDVLIEPAVVPPGEEGAVTLNWKAAGSDPEFRHGATIATSDPNNSLLQFTIHGTIQSLMRAVPAQVVFGDLTTHQSRTSQFSLHAYRAEDLQVESYDWEFAETADFFTATVRVLDSQELESVPNALSGVEVEIGIKPGLPMGDIRQAINLHTSAGPAHVFTVPVYARVVGDVNITGRGYRSAEDLLLLGQIQRDAGKRTELQIFVKGPHREGFTAKVVETVPAGVLHAEVGQASRLKGGAILKVPIAVWVDPGAPPVSYLGTLADPDASIVLETSHPNAPRLEIHVRFATIE